MNIHTRIHIKTILYGVCISIIFIFSCLPPEQHAQEQNEEKFDSTKKTADYTWDKKKFMTLEPNSTLQAQWDGFSNRLQEIAISDSCTTRSPSTYCLEQILVADINKDGYLDIFLGADTTRNQSYYLSYQPYYYIYLNNKDGTMSFSHRIARVGEEQVTDLADMSTENNQPLLSLLGADFSRGAKVWNPSPSASSNAVSYLSPSFYSIPRHGGDTFAYDYDGDGLKDLIIIGSGSAQSILAYLYRGKASGSFEDPVTLFAGVYGDGTTEHTQILFIDDFNNDGYVDFASHVDRDIFVFRSNGKYKYDFVKSVLSDLGKNVISIYKTGGKFKLSHFVNDVWGISNYKEYEILRNGELSSVLVDSGGLGTMEVATDDINYDGLIDIVYLSIPASGASVCYAIHKPVTTGTYASFGDVFDTTCLATTGRFAGTYETTISRIAIADFNNDKLKDIAVILAGATNNSTTSYLQIYLAKQK